MAPGGARSPGLATRDCTLARRYLSPEEPMPDKASTQEGREASATPSWHVNKGNAALPPAPPWRRHESGEPIRYAVPDAEPEDTFQPDPKDVAMVNAAIHLRRPLLVTGRPGSGKSSLAKSIAHDLGLGKI